MLSYRHRFHAGNFADVFKHTVLVALLRGLARKRAGFTVLDTHAGAGDYDLASAEAERTGEFREGIGRLWMDRPRDALVEDYLQQVGALNAGGDLTRYPGSPLLILGLLRSQDRLLTCELHPRDHVALKDAVGSDPRVAVHRRDGFEAVTALLPPNPPRGLVFIDPPYEVAADWERVAQSIAMSRKRWPQGQLAIWYPVIGSNGVRRLLRTVKELAPPRTLKLELAVAPTDVPIGMQGCGMLVVNTPWQFETRIGPALAALARALARGQNGCHGMTWLTPP